MHGAQLAHTHFSEELSLVERQRSAEVTGVTFQVERQLHDVGDAPFTSGPALPQPSLGWSEAPRRDADLTMFLSGHLATRATG